MSHPKSADQITIELTKRSRADGELATSEKTSSTLLELLDHWLMKMGYTSAHIKGIVGQLLTRGKVEVVFRNYTERFELTDYANVMTATQAMTLLDDYVNKHTSHSDDDLTGQTQRVIVQLPNPNS